MSKGNGSLSALALLEGRWTLRILSCLSRGDQRFSDLKTAIPEISPPVLTRRLAFLRDAGLVSTRHLPPPAERRLYCLAPSGADLIPAFEALARWQGSRGA